MRVTTGLEQTQFLSAINQLESSISQTQLQISSGEAFTTAAQDPVAAGLVSNYDQVLAQSQQYGTNGSAAQSSLNTEDSTLTQIQNALQSLRDLALQANSGNLSQQNLGALATQATQIQQTLLALANTQDGSGNYIFAGYNTQSAPFALTATGSTYAGDQGQRQVQIGPAQTVVIGDNGDLVFNQIKTGNGAFTVSAAAGNSGSVLVGASSVTSAAAYAGGTYTISFTSPTTYQVLDSANAVVQSGAYTSGQAITFAGAQVTLSGTPATGDTFAVAPSANQSLFTSVQNLVNTLSQAAGGPTSQVSLSNSISASIENIDQALQQMQDVQASVGARLNTITTQQAVGTSQQTQLKESISKLQSLDYASAITTLDQQNTTLSAALQAYTLTQGLSLFKYL
ncbi:MAG TPA: flagellar hook-associated protein FlgL [Steroidobacteraceae bacterium]|nr:flagellar hook-associated protein FlgL [Steroidobacteraceae bacterium]